tara:strand:- start:1659 stop:2294 length:636 start_codon:yes stop_codon:yes gene_type:complete
MIPSIPREFAQAASITAIIGSGISFFSGDIVGGCLMCGLACWVMLMNESLLLSKVQNEMHTVLEELGRKRENEIKDLLYFLRQSKSLHSPWESIEGAKSYIKKIGFPASVTGADGFSIEVNDHLLNALGYDRKTFLKTAAPLFHREDLYGKYLQGIEKRLSSGEKFIHSRFSFLHKEGHEVPGTVAIVVLPDRQGAAAIFLPDNNSIIIEI